MTATVALIGANGHGRSHRRRIAELEETGSVLLVALADVQPMDPDPPVPRGAAVFTDHRELLATAQPDIVVICTPPHTHLPIALDALAAGCDVLLEKPPVPTLQAHAILQEAVRSTGLACQVGFQALGSLAAQTLFDAVRTGKLGPLESLATVASWRRDDAYYTRAPWSGRKVVDGRPVLDGALVNPLAHAVMQSLAVAEAAGAGQPMLLEAERYRTRDIEVDDTAFARITFASGLRMMAAVTLAGEDFIAGSVIVTGSEGRATLEYPTDRLEMAGTAAPQGRVDLLENLVAHRRDRAGVALVAPLERTVGFTAVVQTLTGAGAAPPALIDDAFVESVGEGPERVRVIPGINEMLREAAETLKLPSESGVPGAVPAQPTPIPKN